MKFLLPVVVLFGAVSCAQETMHRKDAETYLRDAQTALAAGKCWNAQNLFRNLLSNFPGSHLVDDAQFGLGQSHFCSDDYETAIFEFERLINEYPVSKLVDEARFQIGMCYLKQSRSIHHDQDETLRAIQEFTRFVEDFPNSDFASEGSKRIQDLEEKLAGKDLMIARNYLKWKNPAASEIFCRRAMEKYPDYRRLDEVRFVLAQALHRSGRLSESLEILEGLEVLEVQETLRLSIEQEIDAVKKAISIEETLPESSATSLTTGGATVIGV